MNSYYMLIAAMSIMAVIVFVVLFFFKAGYGYLSNKNWGPVINNKLAWILMEVPAFFFLLFYTLDYFINIKYSGNENWVLLIMSSLFLIHYFQRSFIFPLLLRGKGKMPITIVLMGITFNTLNSYIIASWLFYYVPDSYYTMEWLSSPAFIIGVSMFFLGMIINLYSDHIIRNLRKPNDSKHYIPKKGLYKYVTSANYFGELTEWIGYAILTWSPAGFLFAIWTFANLAPRAKSLTAKYEEEFGDEYKSLRKKHLIPFIW